MGASRENADLFWWIKEYGVKCTINHRIWKRHYFIQDTFLTRFNRVIGCKLLGHRKVQMIEGHTCGEDDRKFCFNCYKDVA